MAMRRPSSELAMPHGWIRGEVAVAGLGKSGLAVALLLARTGTEVYASDAGDTPALRKAADALRAEGVHVELGRHDLDRIGHASLLIASPGIPPEAPPLAAARAGGVDVVNEIEIALRFLPALRYVAITGTNGKTTTTALTAHLLRAVRARAEAAGNIGTPLSTLAAAPSPPTWVALEISSFQLHDTPSIRPDVGIVTNLAPNHLDRYSTPAEYYADKALLFRNATAASTWVTNLDDAESQRMVSQVAGVHADFSTRTRADAWYDRANDRLVVLGAPLIRRGELNLIGDHNVANALSATLAVMLAEPAYRTSDAIDRLARALGSFRPLEHRIEPVGEYCDVLWINDSKSTNVTSTLVALRAMTRPTILLLGGHHKGESYAALADELRRTVKRVIAYGEAAPLIEKDLAGVVPVTRLGSSFEQVLATARADATAGDAVLLSPACSSYDMFDNYEHRGAEFKRLVTSASRP
jgi:UDP-N-acetylmuramoylalanine--D-glutamate ligase